METERYNKILDEYQAHVTQALDHIESNQNVDKLWSDIKTCLTESAEKVCGKTKGGIRCHKETWWWSEDIEKVIREKRKLWKDWKMGGSKEKYLVAKKAARRAVYFAKKESQQKTFDEINSGRDRSAIFKMARKMKDEARDVVGENCIRGDDGKLIFDQDKLLFSWRSHYEKLLNEEFPWDPDSLTEALPVNGPPLLISEEMVLNAVKGLKSGKAPGPSGIISEMVKAGGDKLVKMLSVLMNKIVCDQRIPSEWNDSFIINLYKGKGDSLERGNFRGLKLLELVMKILERVLETIIRQQINIDSMQFGFMPGRSTTDAIFILRQVQEKYLVKKQNIYFAFIDLEKAFDRVPRRVLWWAMRKLGVEEWIIQLVKAMYAEAKSKVRVNGHYSEPFSVQVGVHQGSVLSPLLFVLVMEAISREFRTSCPWELLYADDLVIMADSLEELVVKINLWKSNLENKGLRVNIKKTKVMCCSHNVAGPKKRPGQFPCGVCDENVGRNSIYCSQCHKWIHKRCSGVIGKLKEDPSYKCPRCSGQCPDRPPDLLLTHLNCGGFNLEVVPTFCYLGDTCGQTGGCIDAINARLQSGWKAFRSLLPILCNRGITPKIRGNVFSSCVLSVLLYASETWPVTQVDVARIERNVNSMIRWMCGVSLSQKLSSSSLRERLGLWGVAETLRWNRLRFYGHLLRQERGAWPAKALSIEVEAPQPIGRPRQRWIDVVNKDVKTLGISKSLAADRPTWRKKIHPAETQRSQLQPSRRGRRRQNAE